MKSLHLTLSSKTHKWLLLPFIFLTIFSSSAWGDSWSLTYSDFSTTSYAANDGSHTKSGISYTTANVMQQSSKIQIKKSGAYIYNTTAMPGDITSITLTSGSNVVIKVGSSSNPSSGTTISSGATVSSGNRYFYITSNGSTATVTTITVNYTSAGPVDPTITFNDGTYTIGGSALDLSTLFSSNSTGAVTYSVTNANGTGATCTSAGSFTATTAGSCTVQASQAAATGYNAKTVTATITVQNCSDNLTVNITPASHGTFVVYKGNNTSGPVVSNGDVIPNCSQVQLYVVATPDPGYEVGSYKSTPVADAYATNLFFYHAGHGSRTRTISVEFVPACSTPTISFTPTAVTKYWGDGKFTLAPTITGNDLEAELTYSSNKTSCATVDANTGEVTIVNATGNGAPVTITATLAAASDGDDCQKSVSASYTLDIYNKVTWLVNGEETNAGSPTTFTTAGGKITAIPTAPDGASVCAGKTFVGWTTSAYSGDAAPTPLYTSLSDFSSLFVNDNLTFYAVFAEGSGGGGGGGGTSTYTLTNAEITAAYISGTTGTYGAHTVTSTSGTWGGQIIIGLLNGEYYIGTRKNADNSHVASPTFTNNISSIVITARHNAASARSIYICSSSATAQPSSGDIGSGSIPAGPGSGVYTAWTDVPITFTGEHKSFNIYANGGLQIKAITITTSGSGGGGSYTDYSTTCGNCLAAPEVHVDAKTDHVILSWAAVEGATGYNVTCSGGSVSVSGTTATITGLTSETSYTYTVQSVGPNPPYDCFPVKNGSFTTPGATIDIVEWQENAAVIYVDKEEGVNPLVIIDGEVEHGSISGKIATDLFFSKYFEGAGSMKLVAIFNGTGKEISLANYTIIDHHANGDDEYSGDTEYPLASLGKISAGQEIIFFTRPQDIASEKKLYECSEDFLDSKASENGANDNPRWIECDGSTFSKMTFNGNDALLLQKSGNNIDVIGARTSLANLDENCRNENCWDGTIQNMDYGKTAGDFPNITLSGSETLADYGVDLTHETINAYTARCILFRNKEVTSGENAVTSNTTNFSTFIASEWYGRNVCVTAARCEELGWTYSAGGKTYKDNSAATCNSYQDLGEFDYNSYYTEYENISEDTYLNSYSHDSETGEYTIPIANLAQYTCLSLRFQLKQGETILTENAVQVPIIVKGTKSTNDAIFNEIVEDKETHIVQYDKSIERCQTCNVVVLDGATLTKAADNATHDVPQVKDLTIYPGGKLVVPSSTNYTVHSLALRRQEDEIPLANLQGTLNVSATKGVYMDVRIDPSNWHYIALPYDCDVNDITFANGETAKLGTDYFIARYDGAYRAEHKDGGWTDVTAGYTLQKGIGYIVSLPGTGKVRKELRFPMANGVIADEKQNKTISGLHAWGANNAELTPNHKGWNMIGNPYMMPYNNASGSAGKIMGDPLILGTLELVDGEYTLNTSGDKGVRYIVEPINNGWNGYRQTTINDMQPFTSYFIQVGDGSNNPATNKSVAFKSASVKRSVVRRDIVAETDDMHPIWYGIEMVAPNGEKDNTALLISDEFTDNYDMMDDLVKLRGSYYQYYNLPVLATRNNKEELAFNALPDNSAAVTGVPVNFYAAEAGEYTISTDGRYDLGEVKEAKLFDATTNQYYDLLADNYTFTANKGNNTERFRLFVTVDRNKVPTDNDLPTLADVALTTIGNTLVLSGLNEASNIYVYDMSGKLMQNAHANGNGEIWRTNVPATGVYFVRVNTANGQQTLRAVVK